MLTVVHPIHFKKRPERHLRKSIGIVTRYGLTINLARRGCNIIDVIF